MVEMEETRTLKYTSERIKIPVGMRMRLSYFTKRALHAFSQCETSSRHNAELCISLNPSWATTNASLFLLIAIRATHFRR